MSSRFIAPFGLAAFFTLSMIVGVGPACDSKSDEKKSDEQSQTKSKPKPPESVEGPITPKSGGEYAPSLADIEEDEPDVETLSQVDECGECHAEQVEQWRDSMHAFASFNNPMYRMVFDKFVEANGHETGNHCAGCHDPVPMANGEIGAPVEPDSKTAHKGVTCNTCHGITEATTDGNGSYKLATSEVPMPKEDDDESLEKHKKRMGDSTLRTNQMCVSCHRGFLTPETGHEVFIFGFDEYKPWRRSGWNGNPATRIDEPVPQKDCTGCHMPEDESGAPSHRFPGGHTTMAEMIGSDEQLEAIVDVIEDAATIDVAAIGVGGQRFPTDPDQLALEPGDRFWFDVVVRNVAGGHNFPGGQRDLRDTWFDVAVRDDDGKLLAEAGRDHRETGDDMSAHRLRKLVLTPEAESQKTHGIAHFRTKAFDRTITPRNAELTRYGWSIPESIDEEAFPLQIDVRLQHRRLGKTFYEASCEAAKTDRGARFAEEAERQMGVEIDECVEQPVTEIAQDTAELYRDRFMPGENKSDWKRWFSRGLAMQSHLSDRLDEALDSFERSMEALEMAELDPGARQHRKAMILVGKAQVMSRQRRHRKAIELFDDAEEYAPGQPSIYVGRGDAYANVWQYADAVDQYKKASEKVDDDRIWRKLAIGLGSMGRYREAIAAAQKGLAIESKDPDLLRSQMIALRHLDVPEEWRDSASEAFDRYKSDEEAHLLRAECSDRSEICRLERLPIHTHEMEAVEEE